MRTIKFGILQRGNSLIEVFRVRSHELHVAMLQVTWLDIATKRALLLYIKESNPSFAMAWVGMI